MTTSAARTSPRADEWQQRDRFSVTLYGWFVVWGWFLYSFNPSVPLLARELKVSNAVAGLHGTAIAAGAILAAFVTQRLVSRFGRRTTLVGAGPLVAVGTAGLVLGHGIGWTLSGVFVLAVGMNVAISSAQAGLAMHHGSRSSASLTEANGVGSSIGLLGPLAVGVCVGIGWGWRPAVATTAVLVLVAAWATSRLPARGSLAHEPPGRARAHEAGRASGGSAAASDPAGAAGSASAPHGPLSRASWFFLVAIVAAIAMENSTTFWSTDLLIERTGAGPGIATAAIAGLVAGMSAIRFVVGPLSLRIAPARLLAAAFCLAIVGWAILWTATSTSIALLGLVVAGLGYGAQYPLSIALLLAVARGATDRAQARATLAGGIAIGVAPFVLGALADRLGAHTAFLLVPVLAIAGAVAAVAGRRAAHVTAAAEALDAT